MLTEWGKSDLSQLRYFHLDVSIAVRVDRLDTNHPNRLGSSEASNISGKKSTVNQGNLVFYYFKILTANRPITVTDPGPIVTS
jgi:hypothetical protein